MKISIKTLFFFLFLSVCLIFFFQLFFLPFSAR